MSEPSPIQPGTVVAIIDDHEEAQRAMGQLASDGFEVQLLHGEDGRAKLDHEAEQGLPSAIKRLALAFGDEMRILDRLDNALSDGASVVSVATEADRADQVSGILEAHRGHDMWRIGEWSQNRVGRKGSGEG